MSRDSETHEIDEYLWPLTGDVSVVDWDALTEGLQIRQRLGEILMHVRTTHVRPRLQRLGARPAMHVVQAATQAVIAGPQDGPPWEQRLQEPVPRALRDEWEQLTQRLRQLDAPAALIRR